MVFIIVLKLNSDRRYKSTDARMMSLHTQKGHNFEDSLTGYEVKKQGGLYSVRSHKTHKMVVRGFTLRTTSRILYTREMTGKVHLSKKTPKQNKTTYNSLISKRNFSMKPSVLVTPVFVSIQNNSLFTTCVSHNNLSSICQRGRCYLLVCL